MKGRNLAILAAAFLLGTGQASASQAVAVAQDTARDAQPAPHPAAVRDAAPAKNMEKPILVESDAIFQTAQLGMGSVPDSYRLTKYDVIRVDVIGFPEGLGYGSTASVKTGISSEQSLGKNDIIIGPDGKASIPYVGNVSLAGMTLDEASQMLQDRLSEYLNDPKVNVSLRSFGARKVYVMGEVVKPGIQELQVDSMNAYAAITSAGGYTKRGRSTRVQVVRIKDGVMYYKQLNMKTYMTRHDIRQNVALEDGDIVYVPRSNGIIWNEDILPYLNGIAMYKALTN